MQRIVMNLLENAIKYTPADGTVAVSAAAQNGEIRIDFQDTGVGISESDLPHIFERFYRVDKGRSRQSGGTGLGLAIVKHIINRHRGRLKVESELGQGSQFTVVLPTDGA